MSSFYAKSFLIYTSQLLAAQNNPYAKMAFLLVGGICCHSTAEMRQLSGFFKLLLFPLHSPYLLNTSPHLVAVHQTKIQDYGMLLYRSIKEKYHLKFLK